MPQVIPFLVKIGTAVAGAAASLGAKGFAAAVFGKTAALAAIGAATVVAAGAALNAAVKGLMPDIKMPVSDTDKTRQQTVRGAIENQKLVYGQALVSGPIFFVGVGGTDNKDLYHAVALTGHEVESITDIYFDNKVIPNASISGNSVTSGFYGPTTESPSTTICFVERKTGASDQVTSSLLSVFTAWTSAHRARGVAYLVTKWSLTDSSQEVWDRLTPTNIKALVKGKKDIYDPRLEVAAGGTAGTSPSNTAYQAWSENPALCVANYLTDTKFGLGVATNKIDWAAVVIAADACDATVAIPTSQTQKRFTANGVLFAGDDHRTNLNKLLSAMNGNVVYSNGIYTIKSGIYEAPTETLDEDDLAGAISVKTSVEESDRFNTIRPIFIDPTQNHKSVEAAKVQLTAAVARDNAEVLTRDIQLPFTNNNFMAQRIAHKQIQLSDQQKVLTFPANLTGLRIDVGDRVQVTVGELNYSNKVFRCAGWSFSDTQDGVVNLTLLEDDSGSYADPAESEYSTISASGVIAEGFRGVPDPQNLTATSGLKHIELNWTNPSNPKLFENIAIYASADSSWNNSQLIGETRGTQFFHDAGNSVDPLAVGNQRYYWVRAFAYSENKNSSSAFVRSDRNPDNDTSNVQATVGPNNPNYADIVDDTPTQNPPVSLTLTETTALGNDGSVLPAVKVKWTAPTPNTYVQFYEVQFKRTSAGEIDLGAVANSFTSTVDYGSVADATTIELNYGGVNEAISGADADFSSVNVYGLSTVVTGMKELEEFQFRVRAVTLTGKISTFVTLNITLQGDQTPPGIPGSITATGGIQQIKLNFDLPSDSDLAFVEVFENTVDNQATSTLIVKTKSDQHTVTGLGNNVTRYYWLRSADRSGNFSGISASVNATTQKVVLDDLAQPVLDQFAAGNAFGIEPVSTLSGVTGDHVGQIKFLTTTSTLFVWTGSAWSTNLFTASSVSPGAVTAASFASGVEPVSVVSSLPSPSGYTGPKFVFNTGDSPPKIYRYNSAVPEFTSLVNASDLTGTLSEDRFSNTVRPVEVVSSLPTTGNFQGRVVLLSTDNKVYRFTGTSFTKAISASDLDDQVNLATQVFGQVQASSLTAGQISTASIQAGAVVADSVATGAISAVKLAADSVTANAIAANAVTASEIAASTITSAQLNTSQIFADSAVIGAIQSSSITTSAVVSAIGTFEFIQTANIAANAITGGKIAASTIDANKLNVSNLAAISANLGAVTAGTINAAQVTISNINGANIASGTVPTARLDVSGIISAGAIVVSNDDISNLNNNSGFVDSSGAASAAPVQTVAGATGNVSAQTIITAGGIAITSDIPTAVSQLSNDSAFVNAAGAASAAPVQSVAGSTGAVSASTIITAGNIVVQGDNISDLTNNSAFINGGQVNSNVTAISGGVITTGTINANRINIDDVTLDTDGSGQLIIHASGVDSPQIKANALGTIKGASTGDVTATQFSQPYTGFIGSTPFHKFGSVLLQLLDSLTFTTSLTTSETIDYLMTLEANPSGTFSSSSTTMITTHVQRTNALGDSYDVNGTRSGDFNVYSFALSTGDGSGSILRKPFIQNLRGGSTVHVKLYGYQRNVTGTPEWDDIFLSAEGLAR